MAGLDEGSLAQIAGLTVIAPRHDGFEIESPRYDLFTRILAEIGKRGGTVREIAGNDDIMVVTDLISLLKAYPIGDPGLEHVFDY